MIVTHHTTAAESLTTELGSAAIDTDIVTADEMAHIWRQENHISCRLENLLWALLAAIIGHQLRVHGCRVNAITIVVNLVHLVHLVLVLDKLLVLVVRVELLLLWWLLILLLHVSRLGLHV